MKIKAVSGIMLTLLLIGMLTLAFNIQSVEASGTIYIRADGSVEGTTDISSVDNITYTFTDNINDSIVVERDNIVVDGAGYTLQGTGTMTSEGMYLSERSNVTIKNMEIKAFWYGIYLHKSSNNTISGNNITANDEAGINLVSSSSNSVSANNITANNHWAILFSESSSNSISGNNVKNSYYGIGIISYSSNNNISANTITNSSWGIHLNQASSNSIYTNNIANNGWVGIGCFYFSFNNNISRNNITANIDYGIRIGESTNNTISENIITNNECGIAILWGSNNSVYHNNFINNTFQAYAQSSVNVLDDDYPSGGNYWSDYEQKYPNAKEIDDSGIWNIPYVIDENNQDNYPLMEPWSLKPSNPVEATQELIETIETWNLPKGTENSLKAKLKAAIHMLDSGKENGAIRKLTAFSNRVEMLREKTLTNEQADYLISEAQRIIDLING